MRKKKIMAIILAGGESKRMGTPKMILPFMGKTMLGKVIENVTGSAVDSTLVVLGSENEKITSIVESSPVKYCYNYNYKEGMLSSVICGIRNLPDKTDATLIFQGDQPLIPPIVADMVIEAYLSSDKGIVMPLFRGKRGHPLLIDMKYRDEIEKLNPGKGLRSLSEKFNEDILEVETNEPGILKDFDTFEEYTREINQIS